MPPLNPFKKFRSARSNSESMPITDNGSSNSTPTPTRETFSNTSDLAAPASPKPAQSDYTTVTYQSVPIPKGYSSPLGTFEQNQRNSVQPFPGSPLASNVPQTPRTPVPQYPPANPHGAQHSPLSAAGFTPMRREFPRTPTGLAPNDPKTPLSPTFQQEKILQKHDEKVEKLDRKDLRWKIRVRVGKVFLRGLNFCCSLVVLALIASTLLIFNVTKNLPPRNNLPPWAPGTKLWPMIVVLVVACISLIISAVILFAYWRGGHNRAEKLAIYWTVMAIVTFVVAISMWATVAGILNNQISNGGGKDLWGWSCKDNTRRTLFQDDVNYRLVCKQVDWVVLCAFIEIGAELLTIGLYCFVFYRIASKRKLRKSMDMRDKVRQEIWLAKLREENDDPLTANNTAINARPPSSSDPNAPLYQPDTAATRSNHSQQTFQLQPAPLGHRARASQDSSRSPIATSQPPPPLPLPSPGIPNYRQSIGQAVTAEGQQQVPATPRSVSFAQGNGRSTPPEGQVPPTPRSVRFG